MCKVMPCKVMPQFSHFLNVPNSSRHITCVLMVHFEALREMCVCVCVCVHTNLHMHIKNALWILLLKLKVPIVILVLLFQMSWVMNIWLCFIVLNCWVQVIRFFFLKKNPVLKAWLSLWLYVVCAVSFNNEAPSYSQTWVCRKFSTHQTWGLQSRVKLLCL